MVNFKLLLAIFLLSITIGCKEKKMTTKLEAPVSKKDTIIVEKKLEKSKGLNIGSLLNLLKSRNSNGAVGHIKDSTFFIAEVNKVEIEDHITKYDSVVAKYDFENEFQLIKIDTFQYYIEIYSYPNTHVKRKRLKVYSKPFLLVGQQCVWEYSIQDFRNYALKGAFYNKNILNYKTKDTVLNGMINENYDFIYFDEFFNVKNMDTNPILVDTNLDGYGDFEMYNRVASGSAGSFSDVYLFNPSTNTFEFSEYFSGYNLSIDEKNRIISYSSRAGGGFYYVRHISIQPDASIKYEKIYRSEIIKTNGKYYDIFSYKKVLEKEIVESAVDTLPDGKVNFWEWIEKHK